jgi:hypothetical protein
MGRSLQYFFSSSHGGAWWAHFVYEPTAHQKTSHDLPYEKVYRYNVMVKEAQRYTDEGKFYEASVLYMILSDWEYKYNNAGKRKKFCNFRYD